MARASDAEISRWSTHPRWLRRGKATTLVVALAAGGVAPAWATTPAASDPAGTTIHRTLTSVDALSAREVWAVGYVIRGDVSVTLVKHWDGRSWTRVPSADPDSTTNRLLGVTALAPDDVWAVGSAGVQGVAQPLIEHWDGASWRQVPSPPGSDRTSELTSVDAVSPSDIWAVGYQDFEFGDAEVILQHWDGTTWSAVDNQDQSWLHRELTGVAALSSTNVWAVGTGYQDDEAGLLPIALHWDGRSWTQVPIKVNDIQDDNPLAGVDGVSRDLWAVGYHARGTEFDPLTEHDNGRRWKRVDTPMPAATVLNGVAYEAANDVWAVGSAAGGRSAFVLHWDGASWSVVDAPSRGDVTTLNDVDALSPDAAWAVGTSGSQRRTAATVEHWDGHDWTIVD